MSSRLGILVVLILSMGFASTVLAQSSPALQQARCEFDSHLNLIEMRLESRILENSKALSLPEDKPIHDRLLVLLKAARATQQTNATVDRELQAIPQLSLIRYRPQAAAQVQQLVEQMRSLLMSVRLVGQSDQGSQQEFWQSDSLWRPTRSDFRSIVPTSFDEVDESGSGGLGGGFGGGTGGGGGAAHMSGADFDALIELIEENTSPEAWENLTGQRMEDSESSLRMVISQTQQVHEEIGSLLESLRQIQELQVTVEVRFIELNDSFFEEIGVDFDIDQTSVVSVGGYHDQIGSIGRDLDKVYRRGSGVDVLARLPIGDGANGVTPFVGGGFQYQRWDASDVNLNTFASNFTPDGDMEMAGGFVQGGFEIAVPNFGNADAAAPLGFAILSDIETFFFMSASVGAGRMEQDVRFADYNPDKPLVLLGQESPRESSTYVSGRFSTGLGFTTPLGVAIEGVLSYQVLRTDLILNESYTVNSFQAGLQLAVPVDILSGRPRAALRRR